MLIPLIKPDLPTLEDVEGPFREILGNGRITNFGKYNTAFEEESGAYLGTHTATVSSGTMAMIFALRALGVEPGSKVIVPSFTFMATAQAVLYAGAVPVFAEVADDLTLCPADLDRLLATQTDVGAVIPVHMYGLPAQVDAIQEVVGRHAGRRGKPIMTVYDAAHAFGSATEGRRVGGFGDAEVFSLSVTKVVVSVEGGLVSSRDPALVQCVKKYRNYGIDAPYDAHYPGLNGKMSEFHAVIGLHNLRRIETYLEQRQKHARYFSERIREETKFQLPPWPEGVVHTFKDFTVLVPDALAAGRDAVMAFLRERGVESRAYFHPPVHEQAAFRRFADRPLPATERLSRRVISLPFFTQITEAEMDYVVDTLAEGERRLA